MKGDDFGLNPLVPIHMLIRKYKFTAKTKDLPFLISTNLFKIGSQQKIVLDTILDRHIFQILCASSQGPNSSQTTLTRRSGQVVQKSWLFVNVGGPKKRRKLVNVVCERPLTQTEPKNPVSKGIKIGTKFLISRLKYYTIGNL